MKLISKTGGYGGKINKPINKKVSSDPTYLIFQASG
jgi:hypothetical protein